MRSHIQVPSAAGRIRFGSPGDDAASARWRACSGGSRGPIHWVTGSAGPTTTTKLIGALPSVAGRVRDTDRMVGQPQWTALRRPSGPLTTTPFHRFCVSEFGIGGPGMMASYVEVMPPDMEWSRMRRDHYSVSRSGYARGSGCSLKRLPPHGNRRAQRG